MSGAPYAREGEVREGDILRADGGFTCIPDGAELGVLFHEDPEKGGLYVECANGKHFLDGQLDDGDQYIGFTLIEI